MLAVLIISAFLGATSLAEETPPALIKLRGASAAIQFEGDDGTICEFKLVGGAIQTSCPFVEAPSPPSPPTPPPSPTPPALPPY